jgi:hypothetical protein
VSAIPLLRADFGPPPPETIVPEPAPPSEQALSTDLGNYVKDCFESAKQQRQNLGIEDVMLDALRAMRGEYDTNTIRDIKNFGGSEVYARITASKVRGTAALLREIYTATDRPWALNPTPEPALAGPTLSEAVTEVLKAEAGEVVAAGGQVTEEQIMARLSQLREVIQQQRKKVATQALRTRETTLDDLLWEGGFYSALWDVLGDIATFPFAVMKGPVVRNKNLLVWEGRKPVVKRVAAPHWERCSPFDVYFAPWAQHAQDGYIIHRERVTRQSLQSLIGLKTYNADAIRRVLASWDSMNTSWYDYLESERADLEQRESATNPTYSQRAVDRPMPMLSFYGSISGKMLLNWGLDKSMVPNDDADLDVCVYLVGAEVIGVTINPHPAGHKPFYVDSFERVPGSVYGNAIPALIKDVQAVGNAALRAMVNNLAIASGPMGWINEDRLSANDPNATKLWPWKVFRFTDPMTAGQSEEPMKFFQPDANVSQLYNVYQSMLSMADEITTLPRYMQGNGQGIGGAGRTAAGLSMLMEASNRTIKQTVSSIDSNIIEPVVEHLNVYLALTRSDVVVEGDISVVARGAAELMQRETMRMRRLEFLNITNNPIDSQLVGIEGRYNIIREVARDLNMPMSDTMPIDEATIKQIQQLQLQQIVAAGQQQGQQPQQAGAPAEQQQQNPTRGIARPQANSPQ